MTFLSLVEAEFATALSFTLKGLICYSTNNVEVFFVDAVVDIGERSMGADPFND